MRLAIVLLFASRLSPPTFDLKRVFVNGVTQKVIVFIDFYLRPCLQISCHYGCHHMSRIVTLTWPKYTINSATILNYEDRRIYTNVNPIMRLLKETIHRLPVNAFHCNLNQPYPLCLPYHADSLLVYSSHKMQSHKTAMHTFMC